MSEVHVMPQVVEFIGGLPQLPASPTRALVEAVDALAEQGSSLGRPLVDQITLLPDYPQAADVFGKRLKELRVLGTDIRILFTVADGTPVLLYAGDKGGSWNRWYRVAIPAAVLAWQEYVK